MSIQRTRIIFFSPTGSTRTLAQAVASGIGLPFTVSDCTLPEDRLTPVECDTGELIILAAPVYYGRLQRDAAAYFASLQGQGLPVVLLVNYGNRHYDDALLELFTVARTSGFSPFAAAAFISEHSFSTSEYPMAQRRPDHADLEHATTFGGHVREKLEHGGGELESVPGQTPFRPYPDMKRAPVRGDNCTLCGWCASKCPTGAIRLVDGDYQTVGEVCIICQACVKNCPEGALIDNAPGALETRQRLSPLVAERRDPEFFL